MEFCDGLLIADLYILHISEDLRDAILGLGLWVTLIIGFSSYFYYKGFNDGRKNDDKNKKKGDVNKVIDGRDTDGNIKSFPGDKVILFEKKISS